MFIPTVTILFYFSLLHSFNSLQCSTKKDICLPSHTHIQHDFIDRNSKLIQDLKVTLDEQAIRNSALESLAILSSTDCEATKTILMIPDQHTIPLIFHVLINNYFDIIFMTEEKAASATNRIMIHLNTIFANLAKENDSTGKTILCQVLGIQLSESALKEFKNIYCSEVARLYNEKESLKRKKTLTIRDIFTSKFKFFSSNQRPRSLLSIAETLDNNESKKFKGMRKAYIIVSDRFIQTNYLYHKIYIP